MERNIFDMNPEERKKYGIKSMPASLGQAIETFSQSELMKKIFGEYVSNNLLRLKEKEWDEFRSHVTDWEIDRYLDIY